MERTKQPEIVACIVLLVLGLTAAPQIGAAPVNVDCNAGGAVGPILSRLKPGDVVLVRGTCRENVLIQAELQRITIDGQAVEARITEIPSSPLFWTKFGLGTLSPVLSTPMCTDALPSTRIPCSRDRRKNSVPLESEQRRKGVPSLWGGQPRQGPIWGAVPA